MLQIQHYESLTHKLSSSQWVIPGNCLLLGVQVSSTRRGAEREKHHQQGGDTGKDFCVKAFHSVVLPESFIAHSDCSLPQAPEIIIGNPKRGGWSHRNVFEGILMGGKSGISLLGCRGCLQVPGRIRSRVG